MNRGIEQTLAPALRGLSVAWVFLDVRDETRVEDGFAVVAGIKSAVEIEILAVNVQIRQSGHPLQGVQSLWQEYRIGLHSPAPPEAEPARSRYCPRSR